MAPSLHQDFSEITQMSSNTSGFRAHAPSPCAACKMLRRRCGEKCMLAPYFPSNDLHKFATAHRIFGASNIIKLLQDLPAERRTDAVSSMVYEAHARLRDPVYGCAGIVCQMQSQLCQLQSQLATAQAEILSMRLQQANLLALVSASAENGEITRPLSPSGSALSQESDDQQKDLIYFEGEDPLQLWDVSVWTES